jgi:hypothetical protein
MEKPEVSPEKLRDIIASIHGAIGWISAGTNEDNNQTSQFTREHLAEAARILVWVRDGQDRP